MHISTKVSNESTGKSRRKSRPRLSRQRTRGEGGNPGKNSVAEARVWRRARGGAPRHDGSTRDATVDKRISRPVEVPDITRMHRYISVLTRPSMLDHRVQRADRIVVCFSLPRRAGLPRATRPRQNTAKVASGVWTERGPGSRITIMRTLPRVLCTGFGRGFPCCTAKQRSPRDSGCHESP